MNRIPNTTMYEFMTRSMSIAQLEKSKIPEAILLSKSAGHLIKIVVEDTAKNKTSRNSGDTSDYALLSVAKLHKLLEVNNAFLLPYRYYFYLKNILFGIPDIEDREHILKLPVRAFTSKEVGLRLYQLLANHLSKYHPTESEMTYVTGKSVDTMWISEDLFQLDRHLIKAVLPKEGNQCVGRVASIDERQSDIIAKEKLAGNIVPRGVVW